MRTNHKILFKIYLAILLCIIAICVAVFICNCTVYAESERCFSAEEYTQSDYLLNSDGSASDKKITEFAKEVKFAPFDTSWPELAQVIPLQYLESDVEKAVYAYNGKEYGFYVAKDDDIFSVLLIDFVFDFDDENHTETEYKIRIKPILQANFARIVKNGKYEWIKYEWADDTYYVANPRFVSALFNENALNYGDKGYSKYNDDGLILNQFRVNYGSIYGATEGDYKNTLTKFAANKIFKISCDFFNMLTLGVGGSIMSAFGDIYEDADNLYELGRENIVWADNENNILTNMSKTEQRENENYDGYSRIAGFEPTTEIVLSDEDNSYAEFIIVLNDTNFRSRLLQMCDFGIIRKNLSGDVEYVTERNDPLFSFQKERVLFENQQPEFEIDSDNVESSLIPVYLLSNGKQHINFTPKFSGTYCFEIPSNTVISLNGVLDKEFYLCAGQNYNFTITASLPDPIKGFVHCFIKQYKESGEYVIGANDEYIMRFSPQESYYTKIHLTNQFGYIQVLDENFNILDESDSNDLYYNFIIGQAYYLLLSNSTDCSISTYIEFDDISAVTIGTEYLIAQQDKVVSFKNHYDHNMYYVLKLRNNVGGAVMIFDKNNRIISVESEIIDNVIRYTFALTPGEECYIKFVGNFNCESKVLIEISSNQCRWIINGKIMTGPSIKLKPNSINDILLVVVADEQVVESINDFIIYTTVDSFYYTEGVLRIDNIPNGKEIVIVPRKLPDFGLIVIVDDMITTITLKLCNDIDETIEIKVEFGENTPKLPIPQWIGREFQGFYTDRDGQGIQYINENMDSIVWNEDLDRFILYAHWEIITYSIKLHYNINGINEDIYEINAFYGEMMPELKSRMGVDGKEFVGYFSERDGRGKQYYKMVLVNNPQEALLNGGDYYYQESLEPCAVWDNDSDGDLYAHYILLECEYDMTDIWLNNSTIGYTKVKLVQGQITKITPTLYNSYDFQYFLVGLTKKVSQVPWELKADLQRSSSDGKIYPKIRFVAIYEQQQCIARGSLITLSDGRRVPVETLDGSESLLVWNLKTGKFDSAKILFIDTDPAKVYKVINLFFSDGTTVKVISEHAFWNFNLNRYVYLDSDADKYIGHFFNKQIVDSNGGLSYDKVQLLSVDIRDEYTAAYSPITYGHLCYYVNGLLSMPGGISGLFNIFDVNAETMTIDVASMEQDILEYGLFTYEEFYSLVPVSKDKFESFNGQYLKVAIGKGLITLDDLLLLTTRYSEYF